MSPSTQIAQHLRQDTSGSLLMLVTSDLAVMDLRYSTMMVYVKKTEFSKNRLTIE
jgi:hypothetical protein